jgi:hypothetical protein
VEKLDENIEEWIKEGEAIGNFGLLFLIFGMAIFLIFQWKIGLIMAFVGLAMKIVTFIQD